MNNERFHIDCMSDCLRQQGVNADAICIVHPHRRKLVRDDHRAFQCENRLSEATIASENPRRVMVHRTIGSAGRRPAFNRSIDICRLRRIIIAPAFNFPLNRNSST
ncbi:MAG: hypothetical protein LBH90_10305 [Tannerella sp.]|nr:hypothetical protein [Tannerella sp.]